MKTVYLVRHGETEYNERSLVQDGVDPLTKRGIAQAVSLASRFEGFKVRHLLVSDYIRAKQTAEPISGVVNLPPTYLSLLRETRRPSQFIGKPYGSEEYRHYLELANENINDREWHFEDEENFHEILQRVKETFIYLDKLYGDTIAVTHGRFITYLVSYVLLQDKLTADLWPTLARTWVTTNTGITVLKYHEDVGMWCLHTFNDIAHFAE